MQRPHVLLAAALFLFAVPALADLVPLVGQGVVHTNPFPSPTNVYGALGPGAGNIHPINDALNSPFPWVDEVEWIVLGRAGTPVNFIFQPGTVPINFGAQNAGNDLYIYVAYTQPDDLGQEVGASGFLVANLTPFNTLYGLAVTEGPFTPLAGLPTPPTGPYQTQTVGGGSGSVPGIVLSWNGSSFTVSNTPEPATTFLLGAGLTALILAERRRRRSAAR